MGQSLQIEPTNAGLSATHERIIQKMMRLPTHEMELFLRVIDEVDLLPESDRDPEIICELLVRYAPEYGVGAERARKFQLRPRAE